MRPFVLETPRSAADAIRLAAGGRATNTQAERSVQYLAGGTTLIDLMKLDVMRPDVLVAIDALPEGADDRVSHANNVLRLGAFARMADAARDETVRRDYPAIAQSLALAASAQLRNMASLGGNVLQRTRCPYFRDVSYRACNKREPGSGCAAMEGFNRLHAVLGTSEACIAAYPGDFAVALAALDATVEIEGTKGRGKKSILDLHALPGATPHVETTLMPGDMILAFEIPASPLARRSRYVKVRDRESYEFAVSSAAVALDLDNGTIREARIALGGVATRPWRAREAEQALRGKRIDESTAMMAAEAAFAGAKAHGHNAFKIPLGKATVVRALLETAAMEV